MAAKRSLRLCVLFFFCVTFVDSWTNEDLELFDIVEEINKNFYEVLGVDQSASSAEIRRAYRKLSLQLHPDKNKEEGAEEKFRQLVAVYEVLKDETKRQRYNNVLENGLPDWRQPVYYYRRVRKLGLIELGLLLLLIFTVGHYLVIWSVYLEKKFELEEIFRSSRKKKDKRSRKAKRADDDDDEVDEALQEELDSIPRPKLWDLIPIRMVTGLCWAVLSIPEWIRAFKEYMAQRQQANKQDEESSDEEEEEEQLRKARRRQRVETPEFTPEMAAPQQPVMYNTAVDHTTCPQPESTIKIKEGDWTDDELSLLAKAVAKFPGGIPGRWEKIANMVGRSVAEVTAKSKTLKSGYAIQVDPSAQGTTGAINDPVHFKKGKAISDDIISQRTIDSNAPDEGSDSNKRQRRTKAAKTADRTMMITQQKGEDTSSSKSENHIESQREMQGNKGNSATMDSTTEAPSGAASVVWNQSQQKILEWALGQYPKGTPERWDKIAEHIPGKTKEECIHRFKYLADVVKKKKQAMQSRTPPTAKTEGSTCA